MGFKKFFSRCLLCNRPFAEHSKDSGFLKYIKSRYPYCLECYERTIRDPDFKKFLNRVFYENTGYRNNASRNPEQK